MDLQITIQEKLNHLIESGTVDKILEVQLSKTIEKITGDVFGEYSDFGKSLKETLSKKLSLNLEKINIGTYSALVCNTIEGVLNRTSFESASTKIINHVKGVLQILDKKDWKLSEVITKYRESVISENPKICYKSEEGTYDCHYVSLGDNTYKSFGSNNTYTYFLHLNKKMEVFAVSNRGLPLDPRNGNPTHFEVFLMQLWANESIIEIDDDESDYACTRSGD